MPIRLLGVGVEWPNLHPGDALFEKAHGQFAGAAEERIEILIRTQTHLRPDPPVFHRLTRLVPHVAIAGACVVNADVIARLAAEKLVERLIGHLAEDVPQCDVDRRISPHLDAGAAIADIAIECAHVAVNLKRVPADEVGRHGFMNVALDSPRPIKRLAESDQILVRIDPGEKDVWELIETYGFNLRNFHPVSSHPHLIGVSEVRHRVACVSRVDRPPLQSGALPPGSEPRDYGSRESLKTSSKVTLLLESVLSASLATRFRFRSISSPNNVIPRVRWLRISSEAAGAS